MLCSNVASLPSAGTSARRNRTLRSSSYLAKLACTPPRLTRRRPHGVLGAVDDKVNAQVNADPQPASDGKSQLMAQIKSFGVAGTLSYVLTELVFWAVALPGAFFGYHQTTGEWLSLETDRATLLGLAAAFVTGVRFAVPIRMGAALALVPWVKSLLDKQQQQQQ